MMYFHRGDKRRRNKACCSFPDAEINPVDLEKCSIRLVCLGNFSDSHLSAMYDLMGGFQMALGHQGRAAERVIPSTVTRFVLFIATSNENLCKPRK